MTRNQCKLGEAYTDTSLKQGTNNNYYSSQLTVRKFNFSTKLPLFGKGDSVDIIQTFETLLFFVLDYNFYLI